MPNLIPEITLKGSPAEIGAQYGKSFKKQIQALAKQRLQRIPTVLKQYAGIDVSLEDMHRIITPLLAIHENVDADLWEEFCSTAHAADISLEALLAANAYTDLLDYTWRQFAPQWPPAICADACSAFVVPARLSDCGCMAGQTWDMVNDVDPYLVVVDKQSNHQPRSIYITTMGCMALIGINECGITIGTTNISTVDTDLGANYLLTISKALQQETVDAARESIVQTPRLGAHNFYVADATQACNIECSASTQHIDNIDDQAFIHTNHCLADSNIALEAPKEAVMRKHSQYRLTRMAMHFSDDQQQNPASCWQALADDTRNADGAAICDEEYTGKYFDSATMATAMMIPQDKSFWVCRGGAKSGHQQMYRL